MEQTECLSSFELPQTMPYTAAIIGLGGATGRIANKLKDSSIPDTRLFVFGMNRQEIDALSITDKFIVGNDGLGSGKDRSMAMSACQNSVPAIKKILTYLQWLCLLYAWVVQLEKVVWKCFSRMRVIPI